VQPSALLPLPAGSAAQWLRDPSGRFADRFWNGAAWTEWVRDDPMDGPQTDAPVPARAVGAES
jgi:hypothetical protein